MRFLLAITAAGLLAHAAPADDPAPKKPTPTLKAGDKAPAFKPDKWLQGAEVKAFEPGKVYVVEFWATWCRPCIAVMPHLADLADEYKSQGLTVIGFDSRAYDRRELAEGFVETRGPKLGYTFAWADTDDTHTAWMTAAGQAGIPCSFVVGRDGKLAYIGEPLFLDAVLPKVLAGTWDVAKGAEEIAAAQRDYDRAYQATQVVDPVAALTAFRAAVADRPAVAEAAYLLGPRLDLLVKNKRFAEAGVVAERVLLKAGKRGDTAALNTVAAALTAAGAAGSRELAGLAVKAAEINLTLAGDRDLSAVLGLAETYAAAGREPEARALAAKVLADAEKAVGGDKDIWNNLQLAQAQFLSGRPAAARATAVKAVAAAAGMPAKTREIVGGQAKRYGVEPKADK